MISKYLFLSFNLLLISFVFTSCISDDTSDEETYNYIEVNDKIPDFTVSYENKVFSSSSLQDKHSLLVFYVTTCRDCQRELPKINEVWNNIQGEENCQVITISREQTLEVVNSYWEENNFSMPTYLDPDREVYSLFGNQTVPRIYLINKNKIVKWMALTKIDLSVEELTNMLKTMDD